MYEKKILRFGRNHRGAYKFHRRGMIRVKIREHYIHLDFSLWEDSSKHNKYSKSDIAFIRDFARDIERKLVMKGYTMKADTVSVVTRLQNKKRRNIALVKK